MSDELNRAHSNPETSFEREDLSTRGVFVFMIGLAITGLIIYFIIVGMYSFLISTSTSGCHRQPARSWCGRELTVYRARSRQRRLRHEEISGKWGSNT